MLHCRLFYAFATCSALEPIALKAATILPLLLLQKTHCSSKTKDHINSLVKRLELWKIGDLTNLLREGRAIQDPLPKVHHRQNEQQLSRSFANLMFQGKTQALLGLLSNKSKGGLLHLNDVIGNSSTPTTVKDVLKSKHPEAAVATSDTIISRSPPDCHPVIFESIESNTIHLSQHPRGCWSFRFRRLCLEETVYVIQVC